MLKFNLKFTKQINFLVILFCWNFKLIIKKKHLFIFLICFDIFITAGRWSAWSDWSSCNNDCIQTRRRTCINMDSSSPSARLSSDGFERNACSGRDLQSSECRGGSCKIGKDGEFIYYYFFSLILI